MMVTFISQCEKNALNKTRRVLDAFANRIGDRAWQTVITQEGLNAVEKLLKRTASKNTAVSCHWLRSRSRSDLLWVVGCKDKFNYQGLVPVNVTDQEVIMDEVTDNIQPLANTKEQVLSEHLFAVGYIAHYLAIRLIGNNNKSRLCFKAGCLHDIGKIDPQFQEWLQKKLKKTIDDEESKNDGVHIDSPKFSFEKHPRHNELSLLFYSYLQDKGSSIVQKDVIKHALYWHHAKPLRKKKGDYNNLGEICQQFKRSLSSKRKDFNFFINDAVKLIGMINTCAEDYSENDGPRIEGIQEDSDASSALYRLEKENLPDYKRYSEKYEKPSEYQKNITSNADNSFVRAMVVTADRLISRLDKGELEQKLNDRSLESLVDEVLTGHSRLQEGITSCLNGFHARYPNSQQNIRQSDVARKLMALTGVAVLSGPAGCGKTKIALEWALHKAATKIIWICPRVQVCLGLYHDLTQQDYLIINNIELCTGEYKKIKCGGLEREIEEDEIFSGDIVITTIDQIINSIITHKNVTTLVDFMQANVIFDEYHELIALPGFNLLFAELIACKRLCEQDAKTLLVSATPNYCFIKQLLDIHSDDIIAIESFNKSTYQIEFEVYDDADSAQSNALNQKQPEATSTFVISNTAYQAQISFIAYLAVENSILLHSKYRKDHKLSLFEQVFESFKQEGDQKFSLLRSGPIVQASLNISCDRMISEFTSAENWLQRLGRLDRFGKNSQPNVYLTVIAKSIAEKGSQSSQCAKFLNHQHSFHSAKAWYQYLMVHLLDDNVATNMTINDVYQLYENFYQDANSLSKIEQDLNKALAASAKLLKSKVRDPISIPAKSKQRKIKMKRQSLRGDNRFVQMAVCHVSENADLADRDRVSFPNEYACPEAVDNADIEFSLTASVEKIKGYDDSNQNLLSYMVKKHHNIKGNSEKKWHRDSIYLDEARDLQTPIYLSYTREDLKKVDAEPHPWAVYYVTSDKQPIGSLSINKLTGEGK